MRRRHLLRLTLLLSLPSLCACDPTEQVVARIEKLDDGGTDTVMDLPETPPESSPPSAGMGAADPEQPEDAGEPPPVEPIADDCTATARAWDRLYDIVHRNNCRALIGEGPGYLTAEEFSEYIGTLLQALSTPVDAGAVAETREQTPCDLIGGAPAYLASPLVWVVCPRACAAARLWLESNDLSAICS